VGDESGDGRDYILINPSQPTSVLKRNCFRRERGGRNSPSWRVDGIASKKAKKGKEGGRQKLAPSHSFYAPC